MKPSADKRCFEQGAQTASAPAKLLISKQSRVYRSHLVILISCFVCFLVYFPLNIVFRIIARSQVHLILHILCHGYFGVDILLRFLVVTYSEGKEVRDRKELSLAYLKGFFILDLVSAVPFDLLLSEASTGLRLLMFFLCLLKICFSSASSKLKGDVIEEYFQKVVKSKKSRNLIGIFAFLCSVVHVSSCIWVGFIRLQQESNWYQVK